MDREEAFATAKALISGLPVNKSAIGFWDTPRTTSLTEQAAWRSATDRLEQIASEVEPNVAFYFLIWASDAAVGLGDLRRGLTMLPPATIGSRGSVRASDRLNLKHELAEPVDARDITSLFGPKVTAFGRSNIEAIELHIQLQLDLLAASGNALAIATWTADAHRHPAGYGLFSGQPSYIVTNPPPGCSFPLSRTAEECCTRLIREAENTWREECDLPRIGEGWVSETQLYYAVKAALSAFEVVQHYRPEWLGRQHLDVAVPQIRVALEYQGAQHDQPVAFFGGAEAFARTVERDRRKLSKCRRHGWRLIYVREGYSLGTVIAEILAS